MHRNKAYAPLAALLLLVAGGVSASAQTATTTTGADGRGAGQLSGLRLTGNEPIQIESDKLELKEKENIAIFTGNVNVTQGPTLLKSGNMIVHYAKKQEGAPNSDSSKIDRIEVSDKVYVKSDTQVATGDQGDFDMLSNVLVLSGKEVVLTEGGNVLIGCKLTVQMNSGQAQVESCTNGRVQMSITPGSAGASNSN